MEIIIRKATLKDVKHLVLLGAELRAFHTSLSTKNNALLIVTHLKSNWQSIFRRWIVKNIKSRNSLVLVADSNSQLVGYSLFQIKENVPIYSIKKLGHVSDLYIKLKYRDQKIASRFRKEAFGWFIKKKITCLSIMVYPINKRAHQIYKNWGFFDYHIELRRSL